MAKNFTEHFGRRKVDVGGWDPKPMSDFQFGDDFDGNRPTKPGITGYLSGKIGNNQADKYNLLSNSGNTLIKLPPPPTAKPRPTIIRAKSTENIVDIFSNVPTTVASALGSHAASSAFSSDPWGSGVNPGFRMESSKAHAAPNVPRAGTAAAKVFKKKPPPPRPSTKPGEGKSVTGNGAWNHQGAMYNSASDLTLFSFDPLINLSSDTTTSHPPSNTLRPSNDIHSELESIFNKRLSGSSSVHNFSSHNWGVPSSQSDLVGLDWSSGSTGGHRGSLVEHNTSTQPLTRADRGSSRSGGGGILEPHAIATYDYDSGTKGDLSFKIGDRIRLLTKVDDNWFTGYNTRTWIEGLFPSSFVDVRTPLPDRPSSPPPSPPKPIIPTKPRLSPTKGLFASDTRPQVALKSKPVATITPTVSVSIASTSIVDQPKMSVKDRASMFNSSGEEPHSFGSGSPPKKSVSPFQASLTSHTNTTSSSHNPFSSTPHPLPRSTMPTTHPAASSVNNNIQTAIALYDFDSGTPGDLVFQEGHTIAVLKQVDADWSKGYVMGRPCVEGIFPSNFVQLSTKKIEDVAPPTEFKKRDSLGAALSFGSIKNKDQPSNSAPYWMIANYDFNTVEPGDLAFKAGDMIRVTGVVNSDWLKGDLIGGNSGQFPANFVHKPSASDLSAFSKKRPQAQALHDFSVQTDEELELSAGCVVYLLSVVNSDWLMGELASGKSGMFPKAFVRINIPLP